MMKVYIIYRLKPYLLNSVTDVDDILRFEITKNALPSFTEAEVLDHTHNAFEM